jgi:hypothetical protein
MERATTIDFTKARAWARVIIVVAAINHEGTPRPTFARVSQNMAVTTALLDTLPMPSTDGVNKVYHQPKDILGIAIEQREESLLQWRAEVSVSIPGHSKAGQQRTMMEHPAMGTASSPMRAPSCLQPGHLSGCLEHLVHCQAHRGMKGHVTAPPHATYITVDAVIGNGVVLAPTGWGPKRSGATCMMHASLNIAGRPATSPNTMAKLILVFGWRTTDLHVGQVGADNDLSIIQFLPIYLDYTSKAWLNHLPRNPIYCWEYLKDIFTGNFQGTYVRPGNPWGLKGY